MGKRKCEERFQNQEKFKETRVPCLSSNLQICFEILEILMKSGRILLSMKWDFGGVFHMGCLPLLSINSDSLPLSLAIVFSSHLLLGTMAIAAETQFHVLAVDDSLIDRKLIERLLKTSSYQVTAVDSGSKALEFLGLQDEQRKPASDSSESQEIEVNLIITDYCMPGMTGYDLLRKIKESSSLKDIPVVIMSSENVPSRINRCLEEGAEEFFLKPVQLSDVNRLLPHLLKGKPKEEQQQQEQQLEQPNNKRKAIDEDLCPKNTRQRYSSLTVV